MFRSRGEPARFDASLAAVVHRVRPAVDARALAPRTIGCAPSVATETLYTDVDAVYRSDAPAPCAAPVRAPDSPDQAPAFLRVALDAALDRLLAGRRRIAVLTGGGVDSSALLARAVAWARRSGGSAFAVALDFEADGDDRPHLRAVEARLGCEIVRVQPEDAARWMSLVHDGVDGAPLTWFTSPCEIEMLVRARAGGAECVITGIGGDELFDGEPRSLARIARAGMPLRALFEAWRMRGFDRPRSPALTWLLRPLLVELVPRAVRARRSRNVLAAAAPAWAGPTLRSVVEDQARELATRAYRARGDGASRYTELVGRPHRFAMAWLRYQEQVAAGITRIDPYLDLDLVRAVTSLPPEWLLRGARRRGLLRDAVRDDLPESARERDDKSSFEPAAERFVAAAGGPELLRPYIQGERLAALGVVDGMAFPAAARSFLARPTPEDWVSVWPALTCEAFLRNSKELVH